MKLLSQNKYAAMQRLSNDTGVIAALAIDQRGAIKKMFTQEGKANVEAEDIISFKTLVSTELTKYASSILLDPEYGLPAAKVRDSQAGLLLAYEQTGYDASTPGRLPDLLPIWSAKRIKEAGADGVKFLLYYDVDEASAINDQKHAFVERLGSECIAEDIPFYLEVISYDGNGLDPNSLAYAKVKPHKVNDMMVEFSKARYNVDVLKVEVPVNMNYVAGYATGEVAYSLAEAKQHFKVQSDVTGLPFIFLSAGVSASLFRQTLQLAKEADSTFNGVLCGRATWGAGVAEFVKNEASAVNWLERIGRENIEELNRVLVDTATPWTTKLGLSDN